MAEYKQLFSPEAYKVLSKKSAENLKNMLKGKSFMEASMNSVQFLQQIKEIEKPYIKELETIAEIVIKETYPIVDEMGINLDLKIETSGNFNLDQSESEDDVDLEDVSLKTGVDKRRIINGITQGASIRGTGAYYLFRELLDDLDKSLVDKYKELLKVAYGIYDDDNAIAMMLAMMSQNAGMQGGESSADWNEETEELEVKARAVCFPILLHEAVKGLYEIISMQGFSKDPEKNKEIVGKVDKVQNEPEDLRYGKYIYDALNNILNKYTPGRDISNIREYFFAEIYKLPDKEFLDLIESLLTDKLSFSQEKLIKNIIEEL